MLIPEFDYESLFSQRIQNVPRSFLRDILSITNSPDIISFAGGLPNKKYFPVQELKDCASKVLTSNATAALQYYSSEGLYKLRCQIADIYSKRGMVISPEQILITTGSQQALDILGKVLINNGDKVVIEEPAYLGAIQAFSMFRADFKPVVLELDGLNIDKLENQLKQGARLVYAVPNFQNPTGISYSVQKRKSIAALLQKYGALLIEDDPYGMISFNGLSQPNIYTYAPEHTILLGTFSKTMAPGLRVGWIVAPPKLMERIVIAKQAADLHTDIFVQHIISCFLENYDLTKHINSIITAYGEQAKVMVKTIENLFPKSTQVTNPEGGMFTWVTLPKGMSAMELFKVALQRKVAFVPGVPFFINKKDSNTLRLNFSCSEPEMIIEGLNRLSVALSEQMANPNREGVLCK